MNRLKPHLALLVCNVLWAMDYPFYNIVLPHYVHPMAMVSASLVATALFSLVPLLWQKAEKVERADIRKLIGAALLIGVLRKVFIMYGLSMTSPIDGSIIDTIVPLLVLALSVLLGMDRFTRLKITGLVLGMAGAVAVVLAGASSSHAHSHLWGNMMIFLCACVTSVYMVWFKRLIAKYRITTVLRWLYCAAVLRFERVDERAFARELYQEVETGGLLLNRVGELAKAPRLLVHDLTAVFGDDTLEFVSDFLHLCIGQNRRDNENGFVIVHNAFN